LKIDFLDFGYCYVESVHEYDFLRNSNYIVRILMARRIYFDFPSATMVNPLLNGVLMILYLNDGINSNLLLLLRYVHFGYYVILIPF